MTSRIHAIDACFGHKPAVKLPALLLSGWKLIVGFVAGFFFDFGAVAQYENDKHEGYHAGGKEKHAAVGNERHYRSAN